MGETTKIEWCDHTFNPWIGCTRVSPGCQNCYAERLATTRMGMSWGPGAPRRMTSESNWAQVHRWNRKAEKDGVRRRVFVASLADVFDDEAPVAARRFLWALIDNCPHLEFLLLTKRPQNWEGMLPARWIESWPSHVRLGFTAEDQARWNARHAYAVYLKLKVVQSQMPDFFVSCEPLLGSIQLGVPVGIGWVICGGESGPGARPMHPDWARSMRDQCASTGVPFFFKQWGEYGPCENGEVTPNPEDWDRSPHSVTFPDANKPRCAWETVYRVGKKHAGALLDGREHKEFPK